ncbi:hypothetical protein [Falsiroseomonas sp.]|uniref:hypothetical protein n=1 Tax=Falsiroseomonas sp. TaxID=2870721 RepID=UPI002728491B|nr:hypothetical protein [Falsiroseomonas sp.]MDO9501255.1 hypothetical protein [Falsiroseomonas sp.]
MAVTAKASPIVNIETTTSTRASFRDMLCRQTDPDNAGSESKTMRKTMMGALMFGGFALLAPQMAQAQAYTWQGPTLLSSGNTMNGCRLRTPLATHTGSLGLNSIFLTVRNDGQAPVRITANVELSGNNTRKSGNISSGVIPAGSQASIQTFSPGGSTRDGTTLRVTFTSCAPATN